MSQALQEASTRPQSLIIKGLCPGLTERGKIKIGEKGRMITSAKGNQFQPPQKLDYFKVTSLFRGPDGNYQLDSEVHGKYGDKPRILPIRLLYDEVDLNFQCRYACFNGKTLWCAGDGETAQRIHESGTGRKTVACPCGRQEPTYPGADKCKINGTLSLIIDGIERVGGVWKFRTTSYNSVVGILSSLALIKRITGGPLAGLPLHLTLNPKTVITPSDGKSMNVWVVGVEYRGSVEDLQRIGYEKAKHDAVHYAKIEAIETEARRLIAMDPVRMDDEDPQEIVEEFYPEQATTLINATSNATEASSPTNGTVSQGPPPSLDSEYRATDAEVVQPLQTDPGQADPHQSVEKKIRRRTKKFNVDPEVFGIPEIATCGVTPDQMVKLRTISKDPQTREFVIKWISETTGYKELSYLTDEEATRLLNILGMSQGGGNGNHKKEDETATPPAGAPAAADPLERQPSQEVSAVPHGNLLTCPLTAEGVYESFCMTQCQDRAQAGFCPAVDRDIPGGGLI